MTQSPFKSLALRFFALSGFDVTDKGETIEVLDSAGTTLAFGFEPLGEGEAAGGDGVQYLGPGSKPLERILYDLRSRGRVAKLYARKGFNEREIQGDMRQWLSAERPGAHIAFVQTKTLFVPVLVMNLKVAFVTDEKREELHSLAVNLCTGELQENYMASLSAMQVRTTKPLCGVRRRHLSMRSGYAVARNWLVQKVASRDSSWAMDAQGRLAAETDQIKTYYSQASEHLNDSDEGSGEGGKLSSDRDRRLQEQERKFRPRVMVDLVNAGLVYIPCLSFGVAIGAEGSDEFLECLIDGATGLRQMRDVSPCRHESSEELPARCGKSAPEIPQVSGLWPPGSAQNHTGAL